MITIPAWNNMDVKVGQDLIGSIVILKECCARSAKGFTHGYTAKGVVGDPKYVVS